jgi:transposase
MADEQEMLLFLDFVDVDEKIRRNRVFKSRKDPLAEYDDDDFRRRFRLSKKTVMKIHEEVMTGICFEMN